MATATRRASHAPALLRPSALGAYLHRLPVPPGEVAALLGSGDAYAAFRRIVREIFPEAEAEILAADGATAMDRETERCWAFAHRVEAEYFPCFEFDEYAQMACGVPFMRFGWGYEEFHNLDLRTGRLLLFALCEQPYATGLDTRIPLLDAVGERRGGTGSARAPVWRLDGTVIALGAGKRGEPVLLWLDTRGVPHDLLPLPHGPAKLAAIAAVRWDAAHAQLFLAARAPAGQVPAAPSGQLEYWLVRLRPAVAGADASASAAATDDATAAAGEVRP